VIGGVGSGRGRVFRRCLASASLGLSVVGAALAGSSVAVPLKANIAQAQLQREFDVRLAANGLSLDSKTRRLRAASPPGAGGPIARLSVERLGVEEFVLAADGTHKQLARGPSMLKRGDASNPVTVLAAHRDMHFLFIRDLRAGDEVTLQYVSGGTERYRVTRLETVRWNSFSYPLEPAHPLLALATCYPFGGTEYGGPWRRVAWAERIG